MKKLIKVLRRLIMTSANTQNNLFVEMNGEESANVSGGLVSTGLTFNLDDYLFFLGAAQVFGAPGVTTDEVQFAWEKAIQDNRNNVITSI
jgi:hypothetical protein